MSDTEALERLETNVETLTGDVQIIKEALVGDIEKKETGVIGQQALQGQSLSRLWKIVSVIVAVILGSAAWVIRSGL